MAKVLNISDTESLSDEEDEKKNMRKGGGLGYEMMSGIACSRHIGDNIASSSGTNLRSSFIAMGFSPSLIDKVIREKGEEDHDLLLDTLFAYSVDQKSNSESSDRLDPLLNESPNDRNPLGCLAGSHLNQVPQALQVTKSTSSDSLGSLLDDDKDVEAITTSVDFPPKKEADVDDDLDDDKRASLLMMNFPIAEVDFAISKLGKNAPINELVDFIIAAQIAESENSDQFPNGDHVENNEADNTEALFGTMDTTLQLLAMGFNENEVSLAIEKLGSAGPITELANWICASQMGESFPINSKHASMAKHSADGSWYHYKGRPSLCGDVFTVKAEPGLEYPYQADMHENIKPKEEYYDESSSFMRDFNINDIKGKRPKEEEEDDFTTSHGPSWKKKSRILGSNSPLLSRRTSGDKFGMPKLSNPNPNPTKGLDKMVSGPPFFLYGNVVNLSADGWQKVSQFLYTIQPEFVHTQLFSALNRKEGYIHNLPVGGRFHIEQQSPMTIKEAMPHAQKWWPSWDIRKQLSFIDSDMMGASQICNNLGKLMKESRVALSGEHQTKVLHYCRTMNLVWVGPRKLAPIEPEHLERILGYPINHTKNPDMSVIERLESLRNCFQTDTLGYHLSVLKPLHPGGITLLSLYSGIGGAEVTLHRLGIYLKAVVSVESADAKRKILRRWWQNTDQAGELVQVEDIQKLTSSKLEYLSRKFGGFDLIICQNPCTFSPKGSSDSGGLDFTMYYEFVRVLQRVRNLAGRT